MPEASRIVRARYNRIAPFYDLLDRFIPESWRREAVGLARGDVLEVGVGTGKNLSLYPAGCRVTAIDFSPAMLARARVRAARAHVPVRLFEMDVEHLAFADATFDTVLATFVFCSVPDPARGLAEVRRVCRPAGRLVLLEHVRSEHPLLGIMMDLLNPLARYLVGDNINRRTVAAVEAAGFHLLREQDIAGPLVKLIVARPAS